MSDAWLSSSEQTRVSGPANVVSTPRLAAKPVVNSTAASVCFQSASSRLELVVHRARAHDEPRRAGPGAPTVDGVVRGGDDRGVVGEAEVVVRRERHEALGRRRVERARRAPLPGVDDVLRSGRGPLVPGHVVDLVEGAGQRVHGAVQLLRRDRERRHQHDDVAERSQQHAAVDRGGAHAPPPAQAVGRGCELHATHQAAQSHLLHRRVRRDAVVEQAAQLLAAGAHVVEHRPRVEQLEVAQRDRGCERVPRVRVTVVQRALGEIRAEEGVEDAAARDRGRHRRGTRR